MHRFLVGVIAMALSATMTTAASAQDAYTTRIEPRNFYGAMVTIEAGVRVFRPLPPTRHVIVNPGGQTPLSMSFNETRVYEDRNVYHYGDNDHSGAIYGGYTGGAAFPSPRRFRGNRMMRGGRPGRTVGGR